MSSSLGSELQLFRKGAGLTQLAVARQLGVQRATLAQWEAGRHRPSAEHLRKLDGLYGARGTLIALGDAERSGTEPGPVVRNLFVADVFSGVADALVDAMVAEGDGRPLGWAHNMAQRGRPTPMSTAYAIRTLQLLDDARTDLHALADELDRQRSDEGWSNRTVLSGRPEVTAVVLAALARLGRNVESELHLLDQMIGDFSRSRPFVLAVVLDSVLAIRSGASLVDTLVRALLAARHPSGELLLWPANADAPRGLVEPSLAHTARAATVLRLAGPQTSVEGVDEAVEMATSWIVARTKDDDGVTEILEPDPGNKAADIPINHFTSAWVVRALSGVDGVPALRLQAAMEILWECYSPQDRLWVWRADGKLPIWMTHDAVAALRAMSLASTPTPVPAPSSTET